MFDVHVNECICTSAYSYIFTRDRIEVLQRVCNKPETGNLKVLSVSPSSVCGLFSGIKSHS
jgi:hypothetical protein